MSHLAVAGRRPIPSLAAALAALAAAAALVAQQPPRPQFTFATVTRAGPGETVQAMRPFQHGVCRAGDGRWYVLVGRQPGADGRAADLELWRSADGRQWQRAAQVASAPGHGGAVAPGADGRRLHLLWDAPRGGWMSVCHRVFDLQAQQWAGAVRWLATGTGGDDQYYANDLAITAGGVLVAAIGSHRAPQLPAFRIGWSTAVARLAPGDGPAQDPRWTALEQLNSGTFGVHGDLAVDGDVVHSAFRSNSDGVRIALRSYDVATGRFRQPRDEVAAQAAAGGLEVANASVTAVDPLGNRYVLHTIGGRRPGQGRLAVAVAAGAAGPWRSVAIADDPPLQGGNYNYTHFALARGPGGQLLVFYSRRADGCATLYQQVLDGGAVVAGERVVQRGTPGAFERLTGLRQELGRQGVQLVVSGGPDQEDRTSVRVFGLLGGAPR